MSGAILWDWNAGFALRAVDKNGTILATFYPLATTRPKKIECELELDQESRQLVDRSEDPWTYGTRAIYTVEFCQTGTAHVIGAAPYGDLEPVLAYMLYRDNYGQMTINGPDLDLGTWRDVSIVEPPTICSHRGQFKTSYVISLRLRERELRTGTPATPTAGQALFDPRAYIGGW